MENGSQNLKKQDSTYGLLRTRSPTMKQGEELDICLAIFMDDVTHALKWLGAPSLQAHTTCITPA
eukprot:4707438-Pyramimonas_sp.AAC.1